MTCEGNVCGTGGWNGPLPGDPDNNIRLAANTTYGGIDVRWSYPLKNGYAVAYTSVFRGLESDFSKSVELDKVGGSMYFDKLNPTVATTYYYWIQVVSINGTVNEVIGPVSAEAVPLAKQTLESLTDQIDAGQLAHDLKTSIAGLTLTNQQLFDEIKNRLLANSEFAAALAAVQSGLEDAMTFVSNEITQRKDGDDALVQQITILAAANKSALAALEEERTVRVTADEAFAQQITSLFTEVGNNAAAIQEEKTTRTTADSAMAQSISDVRATANGAASAVQSETLARINADSALASRITTAEVSLNGNVATGQVGLVTSVSNLKNQISAEYFAKVQVNGLIGGFGLLNNGVIVEAGFDVDRFWIGRSSDGAKRKPFILDGGIVYLDSAQIRNADIGTLKLAGNSVTVGTYATGGASSVSAGGTSSLISRTIDLGDANNSGLIVLATVYLQGGSDDTIGFRIMINGQLAGDQRTSMRNGYGSLFPASGFLVPGSRYATVSLEAYIPGAGSANIINSSLSIMGGKR